MKVMNSLGQFVALVVGCASVVVGLGTWSPAYAESRPAEVSVAPLPVKDRGHAAGSVSTQPPEREFGACFKLPVGQRNIRLELRPDTPVPDLVGWISSITCKWFLMSPQELSKRKITILVPGLLTVGESYSLFVAALASAGLTLEEAGKFQRVVEGNPNDKNNDAACLPRVPLERITLMAIADAATGARAMLRGPIGEGRVVKVGDRVSKQGAQVRRIVADRVVFDLPAPVDGERRTLEIVIGPSATTGKAHLDDGVTTQGGAVEQGVGPDGRSPAAPARRSTP